MPQFRCNRCGCIVDAMLFACPECKALGGGFTQLPEPAAVPPQPVPGDAPGKPANDRRDSRENDAEKKPIPEKTPTSVPVRTEEKQQLKTVVGPIRRPVTRVLFRFQLARRPAAGGPARGCPAMDAQGRMFVALQDTLAAFAPGGTAPAWTYAAGSQISGSPSLGPDGLLRIHTRDGRLHRVDAGGRCPSPPETVAQPLGWATPLVDAQNNTWLCRSEGGIARVPAAGETAKRPFVRTRQRFDCTGLIHQNLLVIGCENHYLHAFPLDDPAGRNLWAELTELGRTGCPIHCPLALRSEEEILVVSQDDTLRGFGLDGRQGGSLTLDGHVLGSPVVDAEGVIYVAVSRNPLNRPASGALLAIRDWRVIWRVETEFPLESSPVLGDDGLLYFGDNGGIVHAVDPSGQTVWTENLGCPIRSGLSIWGEKQLVFTLDDGTLVVLSCSACGLNPGPWPKLLGSLKQSGCTERESSERA